MLKPSPSAAVHPWAPAVRGSLVVTGEAGTGFGDALAAVQKEIKVATPPTIAGALGAKVGAPPVPKAGQAVPTPDESPAKSVVAVVDAVPGRQPKGAAVDGTPKEKAPNDRLTDQGAEIDPAAQSASPIIAPVVLNALPVVPAMPLPLALTPALVDQVATLAPQRPVLACSGMAGTVASIFPDASSVTADATAAAPIVTPAMPDAAMAVSDAATAVPSAALATPITATALSDAATAPFNVAVALPTAGPATPKAETAAPDAAMALPTAAQAAPNAATAVPDAAPALPTAASPVPRADTALPNVTAQLPGGAGDRYDLPLPAVTKSPGQDAPAPAAVGPRVPSPVEQAVKQAAQPVAVAGDAAPAVGLPPSAPTVAVASPLPGALAALQALAAGSVPAPQQAALVAAQAVPTAAPLARPGATPAVVSRQQPSSDVAVEQGQALAAGPPVSIDDFPGQVVAGGRGMVLSRIAGKAERGSDPGDTDALSSLSPSDRPGTTLDPAGNAIDLKSSFVSSLPELANIGVAEKSANPSPRKVGQEAADTTIRSDGAAANAGPAIDPGSVTNPHAASSPKADASRPAADSIAAPSVADQVSSSMVAMARNYGADGRISISITPDQLGQVHIVVERATDGTTTIHLAAEQLATLDLLRQDQGSLNQALDQAGIGTGGHTLSFSWEGGAGGGSRSGWYVPDDTAPENKSTSLAGVYAVDPASNRLAMAATARGGVDVTA